MQSPNNRISILAASTAALLIGSSQAAVIAVNFFNGTWADNTGANGAETAMGIAATDWTNISVAEAGAALTGTTTISTVSMTWHGSNSWDGGSEGVTAGGDASQQIFRVYLDDGDGGSSYAAADGYGVTVQLSGLSTFLVNNSAASYNLTLFFATDGAATFQTVEIRSGILSGGAITDLTQLGTISATVTGDGTFPVSSGAGTNTAGTRGYGSLGGLTADAITIAIPDRDNSIRGTLAGFTVTPVPEPSSALLGGLGALALLRRRRD